MFHISKLPAQAIDLLRRIHRGEYGRERLFDLLTLDLLRWRALPCPPLMKTDRDRPWLAFCQRLELLTPEGGLTEFGLVALELADVAPPADPPQAPGPNGRGEPKLTLDERALALFLADRSRTKTEIAHLLGVQTQNICPSRCPQLQQAMQAWRAANAGRRLRGSKDKDRNVEAWSEDE